MQAVVLAAGHGTRLRPVTEGRSKAMAPVAGKPLVELALAPIVACGVREAVFVVGPEDREIRRYFRDARGLGLSIQWVEQEVRLGMGHALRLAAPLLSGPFILSACDSLVSEAHIRELISASRHADSVLSLLDVEPHLVSRSAAVELDGSAVRRIVEKPTLAEAPSHTVSLPHYVLSSRVVSRLGDVETSARGEIELQDAIQAHIDSGARVVGVRASDRFQVSTPEDLLELNRRALRESSRSQRADPAPAEGGFGILAPVLIEPGARVGRGSTIGPETYLESGCSIGRGAEVRRSVVLRGGRVGDGERVVDAVIVG